MNREQKRAWALVVGMSLALLFVIIAGLLHLLDVGWSRPFVCAAAVALGAGVIACLRVKPDTGAVTSDERDKEIEKSAYLAGFGAVYLFVIVVSFAPIAILGEDGSIPVKYMPGLLLGAGLCQAYAMSIATLVKYGRGGDRHE
ncbi:MAG: DUF2178 domain-containing protein [Phycisphaerales bacterium]|nr:MAG: DUF2178 domain-containing protein [Phycisphaerales bacterium]